MAEGTKAWAEAMLADHDARAEEVLRHLTRTPVSYTHLTLPTICSV